MLVEWKKANCLPTTIAAQLLYFCCGSANELCEPNKRSNKHTITQRDERMVVRAKRGVGESFSLQNLINQLIVHFFFTKKQTICTFAGAIHSNLPFLSFIRVSCHPPLSLMGVCVCVFVYRQRLVPWCTARAQNIVCAHIFSSPPSSSSSSQSTQYKTRITE